LPTIDLGRRYLVNIAPFVLGLPLSFPKIFLNQKQKEGQLPLLIAFSNEALPNDLWVQI